MTKKGDLTGPGGVAQILQHLSSPHRNRLLDSISSQAPKVAEEIRGALISFEGILDLTDQSIQVVVADVPQLTLVKALRGADQGLVSRVLGVLSVRRREILSEELQRHPPIPKSEALSAQREVAERMETLHTGGKIRTLATDDDLVE